jgi:hypothetical protein
VFVDPMSRLRFKLDTLYEAPTQAN